MKIRKGDRVRLLNEKGEGRVTKISGNLYFVELEDGFEVPFTKEELVKINDDHVEVEDEKRDEDLFEPTTIALGKQSEIREGNYLVFVPSEGVDLLMAPLKLYFINHTAYSIFFTLSVKENDSYKLLAADNLNEFEKIFVTEIKRDELDKFSVLKAEIIYFKDEAFKEQSPVSALVKIRTVKFYKENSYSDNPWFPAPGHLISLKDAGRAATTFEKKDFDTIIAEKESRPAQFVSKKHTGLLEEEVDLHIEELIDDMKGLSNGEMINLQLKHFQSRLDAAIANNVKKIVFIHGVGNGRLKHEVRKVLMTYKGVSFRDASFSRYGFGATEVIIQ